MRKLLCIKDSQEFWATFTREREKRRESLRSLPFARKIEILSKMQEVFHPLRRPGRKRKRRKRTAD